MTSWFWGRGTAGPAPSPAGPQFSGPDGGQGTRSLELVRYNQDTGKFEVGSEALAVLRGTRGPVGVVAVAGRARQGKSFILNQLLGRSGGFQVGPTHRPCTKGLWMWSAPVQRPAADGSTYSLVLLDTEGIDAYDQTGQYSTQIFSLAVLLSSLFIYNQMGGIDEAALDRLSLVTEMTKHIRVRASDGAASDTSELSAFTPAFVWLLRDFYLKLEEEGRAVTPRDYLEAALRPLPGTGPAVDAKNGIRQSIKALFPDRDCFPLVRPVTDEDALAKLDTLPASAQRPEFRDGLARLTSLIFHKAQPKRLGAQVLTGPVLAGLAEAYVAAINAGAVPTIATAWQGVAEAESRRAADAAEAAYNAAFDGNAAADEAALDAANQRALAAAAAAFEGIAIGDEGIKLANDRRWREACGLRFREFQEKKLATAALACERAVNEGTAQLQVVVRREGATLDDVQAAAAAFQQRYFTDPAIAGPTKMQRYAEFMHTVYAGAVQDLAARQQERQRSAASAATAAAAAAQAATQQAMARAAAAEGGAASMQAQVAELQRQLATAGAHAQAHDARLAEMTQQVQRAAQSADQARAQSAADRQALAAAQAQLQASVASVAEVRALEERVRAFSSERDSLRAALQAASTASAAAAAGKAAAEQRAAELQAQLASLQAQVAALQATAAAAPAPADYEMPDGGYEGVAGPSAAVQIPDVSSMTIDQMKAWLMDNGQEAAVWDMAQKKPKKADWRTLILSLGS